MTLTRHQLRQARESLRAVRAEYVRQAVFVAVLIVAPVALIFLLIALFLA